MIQTGLIFFPLLSGVLVLLVGNNRPRWAKSISLLSGFISWALCAWLWHLFDPTLGTFQLVERQHWIPALGIEYYLGVDGFSMPLVLLTSFFTPLIVIAAWHLKQRIAHYLAAFLMLQGLIHGVFMALDGILFYVFWEAMLIPMFLIIGIWGGTNRVYASLKFFLYTFLGSVLLLIALLILHLAALQQGVLHAFSIPAFYNVALSSFQQTVIFFLLLLAFAVKIPMWPVHTWLPDAHVEAPTGGSVILAAILLKMGGYGLIRFVLPIVPAASLQFAPLVIGASLIAIVYVGLVALIQQDMKKLIAYSSIAHMGFVTLGLFITLQMGIEGAYFQMISHGLIAGALFFCVGVLYDRLHSRRISDYGGVAHVMPKFATFFMLFALANCGLPGTSGFVGEFLVIISAFQAMPAYGIIAATTLVLGAAYSLWLMKRVIFGPVQKETVATLKDVDAREYSILASLAALVLLFGVWPAPLIHTTHASVEVLEQLLLKGAPR